MSAEKIIRAQARQRLKIGGWSKALIGFAMLAVFFMIVDCVAMLCSTVLMQFATSQTLEFVLNIACGSLTTIALILLFPAVMGYIRMLMTEQKEYDLKDVIYYFVDTKRYAKALTLILSFIMRIAIPALICFAPVIIFVAIDKFAFNGLMQQNIYIITLCVLVFLSSVCVLMYCARYFLVLKLFCDDESKSINFYFTNSKMIMNGHSNDVVKLVFSFFWWILLCLLVMPILYVVPYMAQSLCISGKWLLNLRIGQDNELFQ